MSNVATWSAITIRCCSWNTSSDHVVSGMFIYWDVLLGNPVDIHCFRLQLIAGYKTHQNFVLASICALRAVTLLSYHEDKCGRPVLCCPAATAGIWWVNWNRCFLECMSVCRYECMSIASVSKASQMDQHILCYTAHDVCKCSYMCARCHWCQITLIFVSLNWNYDFNSRERVNW